MTRDGGPPTLDDPFAGIPSNGSSSSLPFPDADALAKPVTRQELMDVMFLTHLAFTAHSMVDAMRLEGTEEQQRDMAVKAVEASGELLKLARRLVTNWAKENG